MTRLLLAACCLLPASCCLLPAACMHSMHPMHPMPPALTQRCPPIKTHPPPHRSLAVRPLEAARRTAQKAVLEKYGTTLTEQTLTEVARGPMVQRLGLNSNDAFCSRDEFTLRASRRRSQTPRGSQSGRHDLAPR